MAYTFDFINADGSIDHFQLGLFVDDRDALREARDALRDSSTAVRIDVWRGADSIARLVGPSGRPQAANEG